MAVPGPSAMDWSSEDDTEDDEVIGEIDVFVSKTHSDSLYLLQYPLRPADQSLIGAEQSQEISCDFKPKQGKLQLKLPLDVSMSSYDRGRGEQIAINCGASTSSARSKTTPFGSMMDYQYFVSSPAAGFHNNCYAIGLFQNGQLHLTPIRNILQMRPSFFYLDTADARTSAKVSAEAGESSQDESETEAGTSGAPVQTVRVKFKEESEYLRKRREASYQYQQKLKDDEPAVNLRLLSAGDEESMMQRRLLVGNVDWTTAQPPLEEGVVKTVSDTAGTSVGFVGDAPHLLRLLAPKAEEQKTAPPKLPSTVISLNQLRLLPLPDQVRTLMTNVKVLRLSQLLTLLPPKADVDCVLKTLQQCSQLVRGCWVVKSDILHPKGSFSPRTGASATLLCRARDYAMYRFTQTATLTRKEVAHAVKIPNEDIDEILIQMARFKVQSGWQFMYPPDADFVQSYPEIAQQQTAKWEAKFRDLAQHLSVARQRNISSSGGSPCPSRRRRTDSGRNSTTEQISDGEARLMSPPPVSNSRRRSSSGAAAAKTRSNAALVPSTSHGHNSNGIAAECKPATTYDAKVVADLKSFLYDAFCTKPILSLARIQLQLQAKLSESPKDHPLSKCTDDRLIEQCATMLGATKIDKGSGEPTDRLLFAYTGGSWPELRAYLIKFLQEKAQGKKDKPTFRFNAFKQACAGELPADYPMPSDNELKQLLLDYCIQKAGGYFTLQDP